ncbi:hypothetical protein NECAME_05521 [Necator americanus]|uniref:Uncharacterized protein n=1 Tax=Necator americanus TaxID=51031 RepID=W2SIH6_NECAM|nr:hypothetical protein NECAME_05521 [Necator americanus]ETN68676.1 hypothetical protein NECAME_05521 [Necator americanus]
MFPENIVAATFQQAQTKYVTIRPKILKVNDSLHLEMLNNGTLDYVKAALEYNDGINVLVQGNLAMASISHHMGLVLAHALEFSILITTRLTDCSAVGKGLAVIYC